MNTHDNQRVHGLYHQYSLLTIEMLQLWPLTVTNGIITPKTEVVYHDIIPFIIAKGHFSVYEPPCHFIAILYFFRATDSAFDEGPKKSWRPWSVWSSRPWNIQTFWSCWISSKTNAFTTWPLGLWVLKSLDFWYVFFFFFYVMSWTRGRRKLPAIFKRILKLPGNLWKVLKLRQGYETIAIGS